MVLTSRELHLIKILGWILMTIDHIGIFFFPDVLLFHLIGRLAYPCFILSTAYGVRFTRSKLKYGVRLFLMGLLATPFSPILFNVGFSLALFVWSVYLWEQPKREWVLIGLVVLISALTEYSLYGFALSWIVYVWVVGLCNNRKTLMYWLLLHVVFIGLFPAQLLSIGVVGLIWWVKRCSWSLQSPKWLGYLYYPLHLAVLSMLQVFI